MVAFKFQHRYREFAFIQRPHWHCCRSVWYRWAPKRSSSHCTEFGCYYPRYVYILLNHAAVARTVINFKSRHVDNDQSVTLKFNAISYVQMVNDPVLTAQFVQAIPLLISSAVDLTPDQIIVVSIVSSSGTGSTRRKSRRAVVSGIVTTMAIPSDQVDALQLAIRDPTSALYSSKNGQLALLLDTTYPLTNSTDSSSSGASVTDPNASSSSGQSNGNAASTGPSRGVIIGVSVGGATALYAGMTVVAVRAYRRRKARKAEQTAQQNAMFAHSISAPIMNENTLGFTPQW
jgi:hypothetical protein